MSKFLLVLFFAASSHLSADDNLHLVGTVPLLGSGSVNVFIDGTGTVGVTLPDGSMNWDSSDVREMDTYFSNFEKFVDKVKAGNDTKFQTPLGKKAISPYLPISAALFVEAKTQGTADSCRFCLRLVRSHGYHGWGNDPTYEMDLVGVQKLKQLISQAQDRDRDIQAKFQQLSAFANWK